MKSHGKSKLISLARRVTDNNPLSPAEINYLLTFEKKTEKNKLQSLFTKTALPLSLALGFFYNVFPGPFNTFIKQLPPWTNFPPPLLTGVDYLWNLLGEPVGRANIVFHVPNIMLYSFGIFGLKKLFDAIDRRSWLDRVIAAQTVLRNRMTEGVQAFDLRKGHSLLFVGRGDFIAMQFVLNHDPEAAVTISETKPGYSAIWSRYLSDTLFEDLKNVLLRADSADAGEYIFFPVKDDKIFLPPDTAYDLSPHKLDILCQNIRTIEREQKWKTKRIIIVGDRYHKSYVCSEDKKGPLKNTEDIISLESIAKKYKKVTLLDPTDIVMRRIMEIAAGRRIVFRATREGMTEYKKRFYDRLEKTGYKARSKGGILTIGYDIFEDLTEQQMLSRKIDDYYPVVLSKNIRDALLRNGYKKSEFIYVPELVLNLTSKTAAEQ
jgi:hypothetical protein